MAVTLDVILSRVEKLLRLAESDNVNEAAVAAAKAQDLIDRYNISQAMLAEKGEITEEEIRDYIRDPLFKYYNRQTWKMLLVSTICKHNSVKWYTFSRGARGNAIGMIGSPSDVAAVRYLFGYLDGQVETLTKRECIGNSTVYRNNFRLGVVDTIGKKLAEQHQATIDALRGESTGTSLVLLNKALVRRDHQKARVEEFARKLYTWNTKAPTPGYRSEYAARVHGRETGEEIEINRARGALGKTDALEGR